jgi:hypothetical protein
MLRRGFQLAALIGCLAFCGVPGAFSQDAVTLSPRVIAVGKWAEGIAFDGSSLWVSESGQRTIAELNLDKGNVARRITVGRLPVDMTFANDGAIYALVQTDKLLWQQFPRAAQGKAISGLDGCPQGMTSGDKYLWVLTWVGPDCSSEKSRLIRIDPRSGERSSVNIPAEQAMHLTVNQGKVWVTSSKGQALNIVDEQSMAIQQADVKGTWLQAIAATGGNVYVGGSPANDQSRGFVAMINPSNLQELRRDTVDQMVVMMVNDEKNVVAVGDKGKIWVFSPGDLKLQRTITLSVKFDPRAALILGDDLYLSSGQQQGENGAVLILSGWRPAPLPVPAPAPNPAAPAAPSAPAAAPSAPAAASTNDCPYQVVNVDASASLWMYEDADTGAPKVIGIPPNSRGLVADRCLRDWCHISFRGSTGWVEKRFLQAPC